MAKVELNWELMFKQTQENLVTHPEAIAEVFDLTKQAADSGKYTGCVSQHLSELPFQEIITVVRSMATLGEMCKYLCEKYGYEEDEENENVRGKFE